MKNKVVLMTVLCAAMLTAGCGSNKNTAETNTQTETETTSEAGSEADTEGETETSTEETEVATLPEYTASDYVTLGEYKGLEVTLTPVEITDEQVQEQIEADLQENDKMEAAEEGTVADGDTVDIDFEGKIDGEVFDGGTSKGYSLTIGSNSFIDGFETGLIGTNVGETVDLNLKFPDTYSNEDVAGKDVVFTVTVNSIQTVPELTDELVAEISEYKTVDEYRAGIRSNLEETAKSNQQTQEKSDLVSLAVENATINGYPEELVAYNTNQMNSYYESYAEQSEMEFADFLNQYFGMDEAQFAEQVDMAVKSTLDSQMVLKAIAEAEKMEISDEEYAEGVKKYTEQYGAESEEAFMEQYGEVMIRESLLNDKVLELLVKNAVTKEASEVETETESGTEAAGSEEPETEAAQTEE